MSTDETDEPKRRKHMIPRWVVDSHVTKQVAIRAGAWALGGSGSAGATLWLWGVEDSAIALLIVFFGLAVSLAGSHFSTKKLRAIEVPADEWVR